MIICRDWVRFDQCMFHAKRSCCLPSISVLLVLYENQLSITWCLLGFDLLQTQEGFVSKGSIPIFVVVISINPYVVLTLSV